MPKIQDVDFSKLQEKEAVETIKLLYKFNEFVESAAQKNEPSIISRYLIDLAQNFSSFYNEHKIITEDKVVQDARLALTYACRYCTKNRCDITWHGDAKQNVGGSALKNKEVKI